MVPVEDPGLGYEKVLTYRELEDRVPYLVGSFTGWRYKKMIKLSEFTKMNDKQYVDPINVGKENGDIRGSV